MANWLALSPVVVLLLGALVALHSRVPGRLGPFISIYAILGSLALLQVNARTGNPVAALFPSYASAPDLDLAFGFTSPALFFSSIALLAFLSLRVIERKEVGRQAGVGRLTALAGMVAFFLAGNWTTMTASWLLTDLGLLVWSTSGLQDANSSRTPWRSLAISQFGAVVFLAAGVLVLGAGSSLRFETASLVGVSGDLVIFAAWLRSGLYPFHAPAQAGSPADRSDHMERAALAVLLGVFLIARGLTMMPGEFAYSSVLFSLALLGVGATAILVLSEGSFKPSHAWTVLAIGAPLLLTPFVAILAARPALVIWLGLGLFDFSCILVCAGTLSLNSRRVPLQRILWGAAISTAAGLPLTPAFLGRAGLYAAAIRSGEGVLVAAFSAATALALIPLWRAFLDVESVEGQEPGLVDYVGAVALLLPMLVEGLAPIVVTSVFGREVEDASSTAIDALVRAPNVFEPLMLFGALLLPLPVAFYVARMRRDRAAQTGIASLSVTRIFDGSEIRRAVVIILDSIGILARQVSALIEQHPLGWILFAAIWVAVWLLNGLGSG